MEDLNQKGSSSLLVRRGDLLPDIEEEQGKKRAKRIDSNQSDAKANQPSSILILLVTVLRNPTPNSY